MNEYNITGSYDAACRIIERFGLQVTDRFPPPCKDSVDWNIEVPEEIVDDLHDACDGMEVALALI